MTILALIIALALEQFRPLSNRNLFTLAFVRLANQLERGLNAGEYRNGVGAWLVLVLPLLIISFVVYALLCRVNAGFALFWSVAILYLTMGFRQFSHAFSGISKALQAEDLDAARALLSDWNGQHAAEMSADEVSKVAIEQGLADSYRYVFGTLFWFVVLAWFVGPAGALLYRAASLLAQKWGRSSGPFGQFAVTALELLDYLPVRLTAASFAIMGNFEDAVYCWRTQAQSWADYIDGVLLSSGAGAIGVRLGDTLHQDHTVKFRPELGVGDAASPDYLASAVGLIWRTAILWVAIVLLFSLGSWLGAVAVL
ncbi:MAG: hypothetical protein RL571_1535 [Pseudomonadota bacterium]